MLVRNHTPFSPLFFASKDVEGRRHGVFVLRGTFRIVPFQPALPVPEQQPLVVSDTFFGEPAKSSLRFESDLAPWKSRADIHVHAVAHAPGGWAAPRWQVRVQVGSLEKRLTVFGPRRWVREGDRYRLTEPESCTSVPIRYEHAFGGVWRSPWGKLDVLHENPVGKGYVAEGEAPGEPSLPAPQIESPDEPIRELGRRHRPEGLGPLFRAWLPRRALAGTYDEKWLSERWPELPLDFDFDFYQSAHPDMVYPGLLRGDEDVLLEGVDPRGPIAFSLPKVHVALLVRLESPGIAVVPLALDTLVIEVPEERAHLTWRARMPPPQSVHEIEIKMRQEA